MSINYQLIGQRIKDCRSQQHLKQDALAWNAEISSSYLSCIENGAKKASLGSLVRIAKALNVSVEFILFGEKVYEDDSCRKLHAVLYDCGKIEKTIIMDTVLGAAMAVKRSMRTNRLS